MKKTIGVLIPIILVSLLTGCAELFEFNLFKALDPIKMPDAAMLSEMEDEEGVSGVLDYLEAELGSPSFIEKLDEEPGAYDVIEDYLTSIYTVGTPPANEEQQRAAILYADLNLKTTGGEELVNNSVSALVGGDFGTTDWNSPAEIKNFLLGFLPQVMPSGVNSQSAFDEMIQGFVAASAAYDDFGNSSLTDIPDEINMGDVAQKAIALYVIAEVLSSTSYTSTHLYQLSQGIDPGNPVGTITDPFAAGTSVNKILTAAGIDVSNFQ